MKRRRTSKIKIKGRAIRRKLKIYKEHLKDNFEFAKFARFLFKKPKRKFLRFKNSKNHFCYLLRFLLSSRIAILFLFLIMMAKTIMFNSNLKLPEVYIRFLPIFFSIFASILIFPLFFVKKDKNRFRLIMFYNIIYSILLFADNVYWEYSSNFISFSQIMYIKYAEEITGTINYLIKPIHFIYFIDIPIILALWYIARRPINKKKSRYVKNRGKRKLIFAMIYTILIFFIIIPEQKFMYMTMNNKIYSKENQVETGTILGYHFLDIYNTINIKEIAKYKTYDEMIEDYDKLIEYKERNYKEEDIYGIAKGKNVIVVQLESVQNFVYNKVINGKEITPNLNKFLEDNINISKMICQSYTSTADSEYTAITSLYPLDNGQVFSGYFATINNDIFKLYKDAGYSTSYMHGNIGGFWNRKSVFSRLDIDNISFLDDFEDKSEMVHKYLSDELFYKQAVKKLTDGEGPFFAFLTAASSHTPFDLIGLKNKEEKVNIDVRKI